MYCAGGGLGDSLVASVVARALHERYARVDALTLPGHVPALSRVPDIDEVLAGDGDESALISTLQRRAYDAAVVTWASARTARVAQLARIPIRVGQAHRLYSWRFTHRVPVRSESGDVTSHWSQILLDYARAIGCDAPNAVPAFVPAPQDEAAAAEAMRRHEAQEGRFIVLHPANAIATRRAAWPLGGWTRLAKALRDAFDAPVLVSGSAREGEMCAAIASAAQARSVAGELGIGAFGALARRSLLFAGITTGTMHVAAAAGARTVGIFPFQTDTPERWAPLGAHTAIVRASYPCRRGERKETCPDYACIEHLAVDRVVAAGRALLAAPR